MLPALSIIIPAYNEEATIATLLDLVLKLNIDGGKEIIVVDDGSTDSTYKIANSYQNDEIRVMMHEKNKGKGAAVRTGLSSAQGTYVVIQDADLEYNPEDIRKMFTYAKENKYPVVYGSRRLKIPGEKKPKGASWYFYLGGLGVTVFTNILYNSRITDEPTCYKMIRSDVLQRILPLSSVGFEFCPEVTAKILRTGNVIHEIGIHYNARSHAEGKKISVKDGFIALWTLMKYRFWRCPRP